MNYPIGATIQHRTLLNSDPFTIPVSDDVTYWTKTDLGYSEIGVNEVVGAEQVWIRIGGDVFRLAMFNDISGGGGPADTDGLPQGTTNLYYADALARAAISAGTGISYNSTTGVITNTGTALTDTDGLPEGTTNLYYADTLARNAFSGGTGINVDNTTGVISYTGGTINDYNGFTAGQVLAPTLIPQNTFYDVDVSTYNLVRLETFATCYDITANKYYTWQHVIVIRNIGGTYTKVREYYTMEDLDSQATNTDVTTTIAGPLVSVGLISTDPSLVYDGMARTMVIGM